jgi:hypothetical protein
VTEVACGTAKSVRLGLDASVAWDLSCPVRSSGRAHYQAEEDLFQHSLYPQIQMQGLQSRQRESPFSCGRLSHRADCKDGVIRKEGRTEELFFEKSWFSTKIGTEGRVSLDWKRCYKND